MEAVFPSTVANICKLFVAWQPICFNCRQCWQTVCFWATNLLQLSPIFANCLFLGNQFASTVAYQQKAVCFNCLLYFQNICFRATNLLQLLSTSKRQFLLPPYLHTIQPIFPPPMLPATDISNCRQAIEALFVFNC